MKIWKLRRSLYRGARILGDVQAIERGPGAVAKRAERKLLWRVLGRWLGRLTK
jgi:hypothetical protein